MRYKIFTMKKKRIKRQIKKLLKSKRSKFKVSLEFVFQNSFLLVKIKKLEKHIQ